MAWKPNHGEKWADSPSFRQFMAEYMVSFPAANLDDTREAIAGLRDLYDWLRSPSCSLAYERVFVLSGDAGSGKTHGTVRCCAIGLEKANSCVTFGHGFVVNLIHGTGYWRISDCRSRLEWMVFWMRWTPQWSIGVATHSLYWRDQWTRPLRYWRRPPIRCLTSSSAQTVFASRRYLQTPFIRHCLPDVHELPIEEHAGFAGVERDACQAFFRHYELEPPISPIPPTGTVQPLFICAWYVKHSTRAASVVCQWVGMVLAPTIRAFLQEKERQFAADYETSENANIVGGSLMAIVRSIADANDTVLSYSQAPTGNLWRETSSQCDTCSWMAYKKQAYL